MIKPVSPVKGHNRQARKQAATHFKDLAKEAWSEWEEIPFKSEAIARGITAKVPEGLVRFVKNNRYSVQFFHHETEWGQVEQLVVRRHDQKPVHSWVDMQRIKDELAGCDRVAIEVFPTQEQLVDQANVYHLWVLPEGFQFPFGLHFDGWSQGKGAIAGGIA